MSTNPYLLPTIIEATRTVSGLSPSIPQARCITFFNTLPNASTDPIQGVTLLGRADAGVRITNPTPAPVATVAYPVGARFTLTAAQAVNVGGLAGVYQVKEAFTPTSTTIPTAQAPFIFYVGPQLETPHTYANGNPYQGFTQDPWNPGYQYDRTIAVRGRVVIEAAGSLAPGVRLMADNQGRATAHAGGSNVQIGYAVTGTTAAGQFLLVELRIL